MKNGIVKKISICSMLAALFVALELLSSTFGKIAFLDGYQIPISCFPLIIAAMLFGVEWSFATAVVGSFISQIPFGISWNTIIWMIPTIVYALSVAILYNLFPKNNNKIVLSIELFISSIILSSLNIGASYISNWITSGKAVANLIALFASLKLVGGIIFAIIFAVIVPPIVVKIKKIIKI